MADGAAISCAYATICGATAYDAATQAYCRALSEICRALAAEFDTVCEAVGGLIRVRKGELPV